MLKPHQLMKLLEVGNYYVNTKGWTKLPDRPVISDIQEV
jgi:hypothetical protein